MNIKIKTEHQLTTALKNSMKEIGVKETKKIINRFFNELSKEQKTECFNCKKAIPVKKESIQLCRCENCFSSFIYMHGKIRTSRKSGSYHTKKLSLRYFDHLENEKHFEINGYIADINKVDIKARDSFTLTIKIKDLSKDTVFRSNAMLSNKTTNRNYQISNVDIWNLKEQLPEVFDK
ncbi:hypothetical protein [Vreelandella stevensii]|uniref:hypothetical protein n=1 Tax=Vreelandella stevensii TaxID=502821 RepID=UPI003748F5B4